MEPKAYPRRQITPPGRPFAESHVAASNEYSFRQLTAPALNGVLQDHNAVNFRLLKTMADFTQQLSSIHEQHAEELQMLVETFRKRNAELRRERPPYQSSLFTSWEVLLQEVEVDSQIHGDIARSLGRQVGMMLLEKTFHRKIQSRKIFLHRESFETILSKAEELLNKCHQDYAEAFTKLLTVRSHTKLAEYYDMHNAYVQQLHAANGMLDYYHKVTLPKLLEELEEVYIDLSDTVSKSILSAADMLANKSKEQANHYENIAAAAQVVNTRADISNFIRSLNPEKMTQPVVKHIFSPPYLENDPTHMESGMMLRNELVIDRLSNLQLPSRSQTLKQDVHNLEAQIKQLQEAVESMERMQQRSLESCLYNKANELQEDISLKKFDLQVAHVHLAAVKAQLELFASSHADHPLESNHVKDRKQSNASTVSIKNKWLKAIRSLKTGSSGNLSEKNDVADKKNHKSGSRPLSATPATLDAAHVFQEYTYKKITACDHCKEILRGHSRQGLKCKMCKVNVHVECQDKVEPCQPKPRLLRRQKSTSEIEAKITVTDGGSGGGGDEEKSQGVDPIYQLLKQAGDLSGVPRRNERERDRSDKNEKDYALSVSPREQIGSSNSSSLTSLQQQRWPRSNASSSASSSSSYLLTVSSHQDHASTSGVGSNRRIVSAPHSPQRKRLSLRMKSFSLDSPESSEHVHRRHQLGQSTSYYSTHSQSPQSPVHSGRHHLSTAKTVRMSSVDLPDDNEKSLSSASTSPCPSPKPHRLLPTNLYVVLYNFRSRHQDEIDLKAGYMITVTDTTDPDWWQGKCLGKIGYFPSKYVTKLHPGERPLQVIHNVHVSNGETSTKLLNEQIVIQVSEEQDGVINIRTGGADNKTYSCPVKYLKDV